MVPNKMYLRIKIIVAVICHYFVIILGHTYILK